MLWSILALLLTRASLPLASLARRRLVSIKLRPQAGRHLVVLDGLPYTADRERQLPLLAGPPVVDAIEEVAARSTDDQVDAPLRVEDELDVVMLVLVAVAVRRSMRRRSIPRDAPCMSEPCRAVIREQDAVSSGVQTSNQTTSVASDTHRARFGGISVLSSLYGLRAPFSQERLSLRGDGRVVYQLRRPWPNAQGATSLVLTPTDLLRRLAALVPAPYTNLVRYHGCFAGRSQWRARLPAPPGKEAAGGTAPAADREPDEEHESAPGDDGITNDSTLPEQGNRPRRRPLPWAQLLMRVFFLDVLTYPRCATALVVLALISDPPVVGKILRHLGLPDEVPALAPATPTCVDEPLFDDASAAPARSPP